jgi:hypothetical protein
VQSLQAFFLKCSHCSSACSSCVFSSHCQRPFVYIQQDRGSKAYVKGAHAAWLASSIARVRVHVHAGSSSCCCCCCCCRYRCTVPRAQRDPLDREFVAITLHRQYPGVDVDGAGLNFAKGQVPPIGGNCEHPWRRCASHFEPPAAACASELGLRGIDVLHFLHLQGALLRLCN